MYAILRIIPAPFIEDCSSSPQSTAATSLTRLHTWPRSSFYFPLPPPIEYPDLATSAPPQASDL